MLLRRAPGIVAAVLLLPVTILASVRIDATVMVCRMTGAVSWAPCTPAEDAPPPSQDTLEEPSCCDLLTVEQPRVPAETVTGPALSPPTVATAPVHPWPVADLPPVRPWNLEAPAPPGLGPPIRQRTQTFLI